MHIYVCISVHTVSGSTKNNCGNIDRIPAILPEIQLLICTPRFGNIAKTGHCCNIARDCCGNIVSEGLYDTCVILKYLLT